MPTSEPTPPQIPQVQDRRTRIAGLLPKNTQQRVLGGIALLMVLVMMFSGRKGAPARPATVLPLGTSAVDPNQSRIQEYRARLDQETQKLAAEEAQLTQAKQDFGPKPTGRGPVAASAFAQQEGRFGETSYRTAPTQTGLELDREKREYLAPFASNIALSYRRPPKRLTLHCCRRAYPRRRPPQRHKVPRVPDAQRQTTLRNRGAGRRPTNTAFWKAPSLKPCSPIG